MELKDKVVVVTGGASGIGRALCRRFAEEGAAGVVVADVNGDDAVAVASEFDGLAVSTDVSREADIVALVDRATSTYGPIDLFCSNAGIGLGHGIDTPDEEWDRIWRVNFMAHVYAARAVLPAMLARGEGYLLQTASAAGLLTNLGAAPYSVTKHAAVSLVRGALDQGDSGQVVLRGGAMKQPEEVAAAVVDGLRDERFLILPHPEVAEYFRRKADDYDRWLSGMRRLQAQVEAAQS
jgi:NAD(P)-dependent dehydrogenase (short-subunit alcohol dehydrogenase family)